MRIGCAAGAIRRHPSINKTPRFDPHDRIQYVGGPNPDASRWKITQQQAIQYIETRQHTFYTLVNGQRANVIVATHRGNKYIKTVADGEQPNNLLSLPECH